MMRMSILTFSFLLVLPLVSDPAAARLRSDRHLHARDHHAGRLHATHHKRYARVRRRSHTVRLAHRRTVGARWRDAPHWRGRTVYLRGDSWDEFGRAALDRPTEQYWQGRYRPRPFARNDAAPVARGARLTGDLAGMIDRHAQMNGVPETLVRRVVLRESGGNPRAVGRDGAMGLMQIKTSTARAMGYSGPPSGLLDAETNLTYAVRYLAGAYRVAGGNADRAVANYAHGYYRAAKARGFSPYAPPPSYEQARYRAQRSVRPAQPGWSSAYAAY